MHRDAQSLVSVIIPIYNVEKFLDQCLASVLNQTYRNLEVLCINDGSTDSSPEIIRRFAAADPRVRLIDKENGGYGMACNRGLAEARGEWISIIEPDDWIDPGMYGDMLAFAASFDETVDIVKCPWTDIVDWDDPKKQDEVRCTLDGLYPTSTAPAPLSAMPRLIEMHPSIWSAIYRRGFLEEKDIKFIEYPGSGWADNPFLVEAFCQADTIVYLDKPYYNYRCDLRGSTWNHKTEDLIARPFDRWMTMTKIMRRIGVADRGVWEAHYMRGFNYVRGAITDDGADNPVVRKKTRELFDMMDDDLVLSMVSLNKGRKKFYFEVKGEACPKLKLTGERMRYLMSEGMHVLHLYGVYGLALRVFRRIRRIGFSEVDVARKRYR